MRAEQAWVRQSRLPILAVQSLNAVLMSGMDRQVWGRRGCEQARPPRLFPGPRVGSSGGHHGFSAQEQSHG